MISGNILIRIIATSVPAICIVLEAFMIMMGVFWNQPILTASGFLFFAVGALMQAGYLWMRYRSRRSRA